MTNKMALPRPEIILTIDALVAEKTVSRDVVFEALEAAITKTARSKYGYENDIVVKIV